MVGGEEASHHPKKISGILFAFLENISGAVFQFDPFRTLPSGHCTNIYLRAFQAKNRGVHCTRNMKNVNEHCLLLFIDPEKKKWSKNAFIKQ